MEENEREQEMLRVGRAVVMLKENQSYRVTEGREGVELRTRKKKG